MSESNQPGGVYETRKDAGAGGAGTVRFWLESIDLASREEEDWRRSAEETEAIYSGGSKDVDRTRYRFNILYSNTETLAAAVYNSLPVPDVRRRFAEEDPVSRVAAQVLERSLSYVMDEYDLDSTFRAVVLSGLVPGRGIVRVKYDPIEQNGVVISDNLTCEPVDWRSFRRGPAKAWKDVPWVAFRHYLARSEMIKLNHSVGQTINLDYALPHSDQDKGDGKNLSDVYKRGEVWEIWDKERREVLFIAPAHPAAPLLVVQDPLGLKEFFPVPRPFQPLEKAGSLVPVEPFRMYSQLAGDLERLTERAKSLSEAIKWRGAYSDPRTGDFLAKFDKLEDGEIAPLDNPALVNGGGDIRNAFWFQPVEEAARVLLQVYEAREQTKQAIYEITGISDLLRGSSVASETATAQGIKAQWGSLRVSVMQAEIQRMARDVIRMKAEIIAEKFAPHSLMAITGMQIEPQVLALLKDDPLRRYRIDVETDSTIRADLARQQQNIAGFVEGFGGFIQSVGPAVQAGALPMPVVAEMIKSFSRVFKLGRAVEEALDTIPTQAPEQQDPNAAAQAEAQAAQQAEMMKAQAEQAKMQAQMQMKQMELEAQAQREAVKLQAEVEIKQAELAAAQQKHADDVRLKEAELQMRALESDARMEHEARKFGLDQQVAESNATASGVGFRQEGEPTFLEIARGMIEQQRDISERVEANANNVSQLAEAVSGVVAMMNAPRRIIRDSQNRIAGVEVEGTPLKHRIVRGADNRAVGTEPTSIN